ncbi:NDRG4 isoform 49 [Pan troglodytes]|uniref:NDRG family member 4 n=3 Tax=Hominidae TaxID=9604 RepID=H3BUH4_HUMAN|nr:NDRG4 isoform 49 [Pan troglodytes]PNJ62966.1 NDRG4 isoform 13 [Pongo abelii]
MKVLGHRLELLTGSQNRGFPNHGFMILRPPAPRRDHGRAAGAAIP